MKRLTYDFCVAGNHCWQINGADNLECREVCQKMEEKGGCKACPIANAFNRLAAIENILGDDYELDRLRAAVSILRPDRVGEPLTLEQLRQMDGLLVYVVPANHDPEGTGWCVVEIWKNDKESSAMMPGVDYWRWKFDTYGKEWTAYAYPLEQDVTQLAPEFIERAEKELQKAANDLESTVRRGAPQADIFNLQRKVEYKRYVLGLLKGR